MLYSVTVVKNPHTAIFEKKNPSLRLSLILRVFRRRKAKNESLQVKRFNASWDFPPLYTYTTIKDLLNLGLSFLTFDKRFKALTKPDDCYWVVSRAEIRPDLENIEHSVGHINKPFKSATIVVPSWQHVLDMAPCDIISFEALFLDRQGTPLGELKIYVERP